jgi:hypothetical protein
MLGAGKKADDREGHKKAPPPAKPRPEDRRRPPENAKQVPVGGLEGARRTGIQGETSCPGWLLKRRKSAAFVSIHGLRRLIDVTARVLVALGRQVARAGLLSRPGVRIVLLLIGAMAAVSAAARLLTSGFDRDGALAAAVAAVALVLAALPFLLGAQKRSLPDGLRTGAEAVRRRLSRLRSLSVAARRDVVIAVLIGAVGVGSQQKPSKGGPSP